MNIEIREATIYDAAAITQLNKAEMGYDFPVADTSTQLQVVLSSVHDKVFVAVIADTVVGYIHANDYNLLYHLPMKNITGIAVSKTYRRMGIGTALIAAVENWAKETGATGIRLVSGAERKNAHEFYRHYGFDTGKEQLNFKKQI